MQAPKRISSGKYIDLGNFTVDDVDLSDINDSLNYLYRFTGHHKDRPPLTVAQHTKLTMQIAVYFFPDEKEVEFDCLLHDMPEAYYGDIATPLKKLFGEAYKDYTSSIDSSVYGKLWKIPVEFSEEIYNKRKICDLISLDIERRSMWVSQYGKDKWPTIPKESFMTIKEKQTLFDEIQSTRFVNLTKEYERLINEF